MLLSKLEHTPESKLLAGKVIGQIGCKTARGIVPAFIDEEDRPLLNTVRNWYSDGDGYAYCFVGPTRRTSVKVYMHRMIMEAEDGEEVDHRDGNRRRNNRYNLRIATRGDQMQNLHDKAERGVSWHTTNNMWRARVTIDGKTVYQSLHHFRHEALTEYNKAVVKFYGPDARTNLA